jgi:hypothetical protein
LLLKCIGEAAAFDSWEFGARLRRTPLPCSCTAANVLANKCFLSTEMSAGTLVLLAFLCANRLRAGSRRRAACIMHLSSSAVQVSAIQRSTALLVMLACKRRVGVAAENVRALGAASCRA